jgi:hypothetical protein
VSQPLPVPPGASQLDLDVKLGREGSLDVGRGLLAFNWLPAAYAHRDWLGPWGALLEPREATGMRLVRRVSGVLLDRYALRDRYVRDLGRHAWLLQPHATIRRVSTELGTAMLGGWVQHTLERREVAQQVRVMGPARRQRALDQARHLRALPFAGDRGPTWGLSLTGQASLFRLGLSCLSSLLNDPSTGARERFVLRFSHGLILPLELSTVQQDEALALIHAVLDDPQALPVAA